MFAKKLMLATTKPTTLFFVFDLFEGRNENGIGLQLVVHVYDLTKETVLTNIFYVPFCLYKVLRRDGLPALATLTKTIVVVKKV